MAPGALHGRWNLIPGPLHITSMPCSPYQSLHTTVIGPVNRWRSRSARMITHERGGNTVSPRTEYKQTRNATSGDSIA